jgi:hypothetical protein
MMRRRALGCNTPRSRTSIKLRHCCHTAPSPRADPGREKALTPRSSRSRVFHHTSSQQRWAFGPIPRPYNGSPFAGRKCVQAHAPKPAVDFPVDTSNLRPKRHIDGEGSSQRVVGGTLLHFGIWLRKLFNEKGRPHPPHREKPHKSTFSWALPQNPSIHE